MAAVLPAPIARLLLRSFQPRQFHSRPQQPLSVRCPRVRSGPCNFFSDLSPWSAPKGFKNSFNRPELSGAVPNLSNLGSFESVYLDGNNFSAISPSSIAGLKSLQTFSISENPSLSPWSIPDTLTDSSSLVKVHANNCGLTGTMPDIFGSFPNLQNICLSYNNLTGNLPLSLAESCVQNLWVNNQIMGLSGGIDVIGTMLQLKVAWLQSNQFSGSIPDLSGCTSLSDL